MRALKTCVAGYVLALLPFLGPAAGATPLDDYVNTPDPAYTWNLVGTYTGTGYTEYVLHMVSQNWLTTAEVDRTLWEHYLIITKPDTVSHTTGLLYISSGNNTSGPPTGSSDEARALALATNSVVAYLRQVPNQPLTFTGYRAETEDGLIAYGWKKYLQTSDPIWLMRLPMTKAAVRAMDTVTAFMSSPDGGSLTISDYVVTGASKRGWTTWTTAAVDPRVIAFAPMVIDLLNMSTSFRHHFDARGDYSRQIADYTENGIPDWFGSPQILALEAITEPYSYRQRLTMPKYILNGSQDEFFLPDSSQFYFQRLLGEKRIRYTANAGHGLNNSALNGLIGWYWCVLNNVTRPSFNWVKRYDGSLEIDTTGSTPSQVLLWQATNPAARNFSLEDVGPLYTSTPLAPVSANKYVAAVTPPATGYTAFFVELTYNVGGPQPLIFTTEVSVVPDLLPYGPHYSLGATQDLLDDSFYAGSSDDGSNLQGRWALLGSPSHDARRVAFWGVNVATGQAGLFLVNIGSTISWRRITADWTDFTGQRIVWSADDSALIVDGWRIPVPAAGSTSAREALSVRGYALNQPALTSLPVNNWAFTVNGGEILALPILADGTSDSSRSIVYLTDFSAAGVIPGSLFTNREGTSITFSNVHPGVPAGTAQVSDVYRLQNVTTIRTASTSANVSTLAPTTLADENIIPIRTGESDHYAGSSSISRDNVIGGVVVYGEDWNNTFDATRTLTTYPTSNFDILVSYADGFETDQRIAAPGNQAMPRLTDGGLRVVYTRDVTGVPHLQAAPLATTIAISGTATGVPGAILTVDKQEIFDGSGLYGAFLGGTTVAFPVGATKALSVEAPVNPVPLQQRLDSVGALTAARVLGPEATTFSPAFPCVFTYTDDEVRGITESELRVFRFDTSTGRFSTEIPVTARDAAANTLQISLDVLGTYAIGGGVDTERDGILDTLDPDDDNDGVLDGADPFPLDTDDDGSNNDVDADDDADGTIDTADSAPLDTDNDGLPNDIDPDDDNDGIADSTDAFPFDTDNDGMRNDVDPDDDNDKLSDIDEITVYLTDPLVADTDGDGATDGLEVTYGTDPLDPNSIPMPIGYAGGVVSLGALLTALAFFYLRRMPRRGR